MLAPFLDTHSFQSTTLERDSVESQLTPRRPPTTPSSMRILRGTVRTVNQPHSQPCRSELLSAMSRSECARTGHTRRRQTAASAWRKRPRIPTGFFAPSSSPTTIHLRGSRGSVRSSKSAPTPAKPAKPIFGNCSGECPRMDANGRESLSMNRAPGSARLGRVLLILSLPYMNPDAWTLARRSLALRLWGFFSLSDEVAGSPGGLGKYSKP